MHIFRVAFVSLCLFFLSINCEAPFDIEASISSWKNIKTTKYYKQHMADGLLEGIERKWREEGRTDIIAEMEEWWELEGKEKLRKWEENAPEWYKARQNQQQDL